MKINELQKGIQTINLLVKSAEQRDGKNGPYVDFLMTDGTTDISVKRWDYKIEQFTSQVGDVINVQLEIGEYNGKPNFVMKGYREAKDFNIKDFIKSAPLDAEHMYTEIITLVASLEKPIRNLVYEIYNTYKDKILCWSAAKSVHHNLVGGWLYHTYRMVKAAVNLCDVYTSANRDIVIAGVLLHDIGKLYELDTDPFGNAIYTTDGNLFGHLLMGSDMLMEYAKKLNTPEEIVRQLRHIIISHHGKLEYDAIKVPCTLEAMLVNMIDVIDARCYQFEEIAITQDAGTVSEQRYYTLDGAHVYVPLGTKDGE